MNAQSTARCVAATDQRTASASSMALTVTAITANTAVMPMAHANCSSQADTGLATRTAPGPSMSAVGAPGGANGWVLMELGEEDSHAGVLAGGRKAAA